MSCWAVRRWPGARLWVLLAATLSLLAAPPVATAARARLDHAGRWLTDAEGRVVILHGFNLVAGGVGASVPRDPQDAFGFGADDAAFLASEGFNAMRVGIFLQDVEPRPGYFDESYIHKFVDLGALLARYRIYMLPVFFQQQYGPATRGDGLPAWATVTNGAPDPNLGWPGGYFANPALERAFDNLYADAPGPRGMGIADWLAAAEGHVARELVGDPYLLGYDLLNEPWPGSQYPSCSGPAGCPVFDRQSLTPFERKLIAGIRKTDRMHMVFYEPNLDFDFGAATGLGAMGDPRAGFAFHAYCLGNTSAFGVPFQPPASATQMGCGIEDQITIAHAIAHSASSGDALLMDEWGASTRIKDYQRGADEADANMLPWMNWTFYNCCDTGDTPYDQGVIIDPHKPPTPSNLHQDRLNVLDRPYPRAIAGTPTGWHWDAVTRTFTLAYSTSPPSRDHLSHAARTEVWAGPRPYPTGYRVSVTGARVVSAPNAAVLELANDAGARSVHVELTPRAS